MGDLKVYKQLTTIQLFEWELLTEASVSELDAMLNNTKQFIRVGDEIVNKNQIKKIFVRNIDSIENFILSQPKDIQDKLRERQKQKKDRIGRWFDHIEEIQNFIAKLTDG